MKKVLYIRAQGLGDLISSIPKLQELKKNGYCVYQFFYDMHYLQKYQFSDLVKGNPSVYNGWLHILETFKKNSLIDDILYVPFGFWNLFVFLVRNFRRFDEVIIPIKTKKGLLFGKWLGKKTTVYFEHSNDNSRYSSIVEGQLMEKQKALHEYNTIKWEEKPVDLPEHFLVIFPCIWHRSLKMEEWRKIVDYLFDKKQNIVIVGSEREQWFIDELEKSGHADKTINLVGKTSFAEMNYVLKHSELNILCNGGVMWMGNLLNRNNINIHTISVLLLQPPVDDLHSFNIRPFKYPKCRPCEYGVKSMERRMFNCVYFDSDNEFACRNHIDKSLIVSFAEKILSNI